MLVLSKDLEIGKKMAEFSWQPVEPMDVISFDCDGTLSQIEGIDVLAHQNHVGDEVEKLTAQAMNETGITAELYKKRLSLVKPSRTQLIQLGQEYYYHRTLDVIPVIEALMSLNKFVYILSAGLNPSVKIFGALLGISEEYIFAVDIYFDKEGNFKDYDHGSPTSGLSGKHDIIKCIKEKHEKVAHVGDGMNDYEVNIIADRFIGYGGVSYREKIAKLCDYYIKSSSLVSLLPLVLTKEEADRLSPKFKPFYEQALELIKKSEVVFKTK